MNPINHFNQALTYIENHLNESIDLKHATQLAQCSEYHFQRMFSYLSGQSLHQYITSRRLSLAALDCVQTEERILDIALKYGYQNHDVFTRAFKDFHGITPSELRKTKAAFNSTPRLIFQLTLKGANIMNVRILDKQSFNIIGFKKRISIQFEGINPEIASIWQNLNPTNIPMLKGMCDQEPKGIISASFNFSEHRMQAKGSLDHMIGVITNQTHPDFDVLVVPASTWAIFDVTGPFPETLQKTWGQIYSEWFPSVPYESVNGPEIVWHEHPDTSDPMYHSQIWIPIKKVND